MTSLNVIQKDYKDAEIIIFEKYDFSAMVLNTLLSEAGYSPKLFKDSNLLLKELETSSPPVLFYDLDLKNENNVNIFEEISKKFPKLKIILINYVGQKIDKNELKEKYGIFGVVQRPFSRREIISSLEPIVV